MKNLLFATLGCAVLLALSPSVKAQTTIAAWNFDNDPSATNQNPAPSTDLNGALVSASALGMTGPFLSGSGTVAPDVTAGATGDTGINGVSDLTHIWRIRATGAGNGWSSQAAIGSQGAQFNISTTGFDDISVSFDWYSTTQGEANLEFEVTTDGSDWINTPVTLSGSDQGATVATNSSDPNLVAGTYVNGGTAGQEWFTDLTASLSGTLGAAASNDPNFGIRMVNAATGVDCLSMTGSALNNSSGNWRFDNVAVSGQAVPEPGSFALIGTGVALLASGVARLRRRRGARNA